MREVHRDLARERDVPDAARAAPERAGVDAEDAGDRKIDCETCLPETLWFSRRGKRRTSLAALQCQCGRDLQHVYFPWIERVFETLFAPSSLQVPIGERCCLPSSRALKDIGRREQRG